MLEPTTTTDEVTDDRRAMGAEALGAEAQAELAAEAQAELAAEAAAERYFEER